MEIDKRSFFRSLLSDESGQQSTKRVIAIAGTFFLCITLILNAILVDRMIPDSTLVSAIQLIVITCIGASSLDKFSKKRNTPTDDSSK